MSQSRHQHKLFPISFTNIDIAKRTFTSDEMIPRNFITWEISKVILWNSAELSKNQSDYSCLRLVDFQYSTVVRLKSVLLNDSGRLCGVFDAWVDAAVLYIWRIVSENHTWYSDPFGRNPYSNHHINYDVIVNYQNPFNLELPHRTSFE